MDLKEFFKPTKLKIIVTILLVIASIISMFTGKSLRMGPGGSLLMTYLNVILMLPIWILDKIFHINPIEGGLSLLVGISLWVIYNYILAGVITAIYNKLKK